MSYEENIKKLEGIVQRLEKGDLSLEDGLQAFEEGISLVRTCYSQLERVSDSIQVLTKEKGELEELKDTGEE